MAYKDIDSVPDPHPSRPEPGPSEKIEAAMSGLNDRQYFCYRHRHAYGWDLARIGRLIDRDPSTVCRIIKDAQAIINATIL